MEVWITNRNVEFHDLKELHYFETILAKCDTNPKSCARGSIATPGRFGPVVEAPGCRRLSASGRQSQGVIPGSDVLM